MPHRQATEQNHAPERDLPGKHFRDLFPAGKLAGSSLTSHPQTGIAGAQKPN